MAEQFLHGADIVTTLEQVRGERVAQRVDRDMTRDAGLLDRLTQRPLQALFI